MTLEFLTPGTGALARSPMERQALAAGARREQRDGWNVAVELEGPAEEGERCRTSVGFADASHLAKIEIQAPAEGLAAAVAEAGAGPLELGRATRSEGSWWCPYTRERMIVIAPTALGPALRDRLDATPGATVLDVTTAFGALTLCGPLARETFARFTALDLRPQSLPERGFLPGSVARGPGAVLREQGDRFLMLFGSALGQYIWTVVADAAENLGGGPVGADALELLPDA